MVRTQIQLTESQVRRLRDMARDAGISMSEAVRRCIEKALGEGSPGRGVLYARAAGLAGSVEDPAGATDVASDHDRYLEETGE